MFWEPEGGQSLKNAEGVGGQSWKNAKTPLEQKGGHPLTIVELPTTLLQMLQQVYYPSTPTKAITPTSPYTLNKMLPPHKPKTMWSTSMNSTDNSALTSPTCKSDTLSLLINIRLHYQTSRSVTKSSSDQTIFMKGNEQ